MGAQLAAATALLGIDADPARSIPDEVNVAIPAKVRTLP